MQVKETLTELSRTVTQTSRVLAIVFVLSSAESYSDDLETAPKQKSLEKDFEPLFNTLNLDDWIARGGTSRFRVENESIVGTCMEGSPSNYLCTKESYGDFELELEFLADPKMNSGIQIRTQVVEKDTEFKKANGKKRIRRKGTIYGYQVEIDPSDRAWSGGIYDQSRRGWLQSLEDNPKAQKAYRKNTWNHFRILCIGNRIQTWINDVPAADLIDDIDSSGVIGLQIHGAGRHKDRIGTEVKFRKMCLRKILNSSKNPEE